MQRIAIGCLCLMLTSPILIQNIIADELQVAVGQQGNKSQARPRSGMNTDAVEMKFGAPQEVRGPVGDPPITIWVYAHFSVFFEYDNVIHTVLHK